MQLTRSSSVLPRAIITAITLALLATCITPLLTNRQASALAGWDAGSIIDDVVFTNKNTMSVDQIQQFLNSKVPACDTYGQQTSEFGGPDLNGDGRTTRAEYGQHYYNQSTFPCLRDYVSGGKSSAQLIYDAAQTYSINPQVLIVLLQKEQSLVTDTWPLNIQYRSATGYGCPDGAPCDTQYYGIANQINWAARMYRAILNDSPTWYKKYYPTWATDPNTGTTGARYVAYNETDSCGGSWVNIQNRATQALYNYTPYQPNQATLDANMGQLVDCGAYGNIHFYQYFNSWFGSTRANGQFSALSDPRWLQLNTDTKKIDPFTGQYVDDTLSAGRQIQYSSKIFVNGQWCLRTENDTRYNLNKCIPMPLNNELAINYSPLPNSPILMETKTDTRKEDLRRSKNVGELLPAGRQISFSSNTTAKYTAYNITTSDRQNGYEYGIVTSNLIPSASYTSISPTWMELKESTTKINPTTNAAMPDLLPKGMQRQYDAKVFINNQWYYRTTTDTAQLLNRAIPASQLQNPSFESFSSPRWMVLKSDTSKIDISTGAAVGNNIAAGTQMKFVSKVSLNGTLYYRSDADTAANTTYAVPASKINEVSYENFSSPRSLRLNKDAYKYSPAEQITVDSVFTQGLTRRYTGKININGSWYYRTETDQSSGTNKAFKAADLSEVN